MSNDDLDINVSDDDAVLWEDDGSVPVLRDDYAPTTILVSHRNWQAFKADAEKIGVAPNVVAYFRWMQGKLEPTP